MEMLIRLLGNRKINLRAQIQRLEAAAVNQSPVSATSR
jgi:hypothetical protein